MERFHALIIIFTIIFSVDALTTNAHYVGYVDAIPYDAGYDHGCSDGKLEFHKYLDNPGK
jgi:hypothetical protein